MPDPGAGKNRRREWSAYPDIDSRPLYEYQPELTARTLVLVTSLLLAIAASALIGGSLILLPSLILFAIAAVRPFPGLVYAMILFVAPLGLWLIGLQGQVSRAFGDREYTLSLSGSVVVFTLLIVTLLRCRQQYRKSLPLVLVACLALTIWSVIGFAHHGVLQTLVGVRTMLLPIALLTVLASLGIDRVRDLISVLSWLLLANGIAAIAEVIAGPEQLAALGFEDGRAIRFIDGVLRAPGLTEFNAELGMLGGAYLLGYAALWLTSGARPTRLLWHIGAAASIVCLALSTSRSGALMVVGGLLGALVLDRSSGNRARRLSRVVGLLVVVVVVLGFVVLGATGSRSLFERFEVWSSLFQSGVPLLGFGIASAGSATYSRVAVGDPVFVDNYFASVAWQLGPLALVALVALILFFLVKLWFRSARYPTAALQIAVLAGLACSSLVIEAWEYAGAMMCLALFVAYGLRLESPTPSTESALEVAPANRRPVDHVGHVLRRAARAKFRKATADERPV